MPAKTASAAEPTGLKKFMTGPSGVAVAGLSIVVAGIMIWRSLGGGGTTVDTSKRNYIDAATGKTFSYQLKPGESYPVVPPGGAEATGWPAEKCFWTPDGKAKAEPTLVLLNSYIGKEGPTICPDCGREVRPHNPLPPAELMEEAFRTAKQKP